MVYVDVFAEYIIYDLFIYDEYMNEDFLHIILYYIFSCIFCVYIILYTYCFLYFYTTDREKFYVSLSGCKASCLFTSYLKVKKSFEGYFPQLTCF
jgi:hypothetical protein